MDVFVAGECLNLRLRDVENRVTGPRLLHRAHAGDDVSDFAWPELVGDDLAKLVVSDLIHFVALTGAGRETDLHALLERAVDDPHAGNGAAIPVVIRVEDQRAKR